MAVKTGTPSLVGRIEMVSSSGDVILDEEEEEEEEGAEEEDNRKPELEPSETEKRRESTGEKKEKLT